MNHSDFHVMDPALLLDTFDEPIVIHRAFLNLTGGVGPALFLTWAVTLTRDAPRDTNGWLRLTQAGWTRDTGLSRYEQESARKALRELRLITERRIGMPAGLEIKVNARALTEAMREQAQSRYAGFLEARCGAEGV